MPHRCTECGRSFEDGSKEMLSGCPECGGTTFQFYADDADLESPTDADPPDPPGSSVARTVGSAATTVRDLVGGDDSARAPEPRSDSATGPRDVTDPEPADAGGEPAEDRAQATARRESVEDLPPAPEETAETHQFDPPDVDATSEEPEDRDSGPMPRRDGSDRPDLSELREELNDQFESIKVLQPGRYELNLMELYDREEYIIALQEDGKYTIQIPEQWRSDLD